MALPSPLLLTGEMALKAWVAHAVTFWYTSTTQISSWTSWQEIFLFSTPFLY